MSDSAATLAHGRLETARAGAEPLLALCGIEVVAGATRILAVDSLELAPATTTALLGPNGAGKSTLLRVAGALLEPDRGRVLLDGRPVTRRELRDVASAVLQRPLLRRGTVRANVETGMRFRGFPREIRRRRAEDWMGRLGIAQLAERSATSLSGGEAQRVSLARALAVEPRLLLLDEPFAALDAPTRGELLADLRDALDEARAAALLVTHDRHEAAAMADHVAVLHEGEVRQQGPVAGVLDFPADRDCARTLGFDSILPGAVAEALLGRPSGEVAVRAEDCDVRPAGTPGGATATLLRVLPAGSTARVVTEIEGHRLTASVSVPVPPWLAALRAGDPVIVAIRPGAARPLGRDRGR